MTTPTSTPGSNIEVDLQATNPRTFDVSEDYVLEAREGAIPDSVVPRTPDNSSQTDATEKFGARITTDVEWPEIGAKISANNAGFTRAYVHRVSDGQLMGGADISALTAGDTFTIDLDINLQPYDGTLATTYNFVLDAEGSTYTIGFYDSPNFPYTSPDGNLSIVDGARLVDGTSGTPNAFVEIGNVGFA